MATGIERDKNRNMSVYGNINRKNKGHVERCLLFLPTPADRREFDRCYKSSFDFDPAKLIIAEINYCCFIADLKAD